MYSDVSEELVSRVLNLPAAWKVGKYPAVAWEVVDYYSGLQLHHNMFADFQIFGATATEDRLNYLGASLFFLRNDPIMPELKRRILERDLRSTFFEVSAAALGKELGYLVAPAPGVSRRGLDFDFLMIDQDGLKINVEVTELRADQFAIQKMVSSLNAKRKQLPKDEANILICYIPFPWSSEPSFDRDLDQVARNFFRSTNRINALFFSTEQTAGEGISRVHSIRNIAHYNYPTRNPSKSLNLAIQAYFEKLSPSYTEAEIDFGRVFEFKRWVDTLIP